MDQMKALRPLNGKLVRSSLATLSLAFLVTGVLVFFGIDQVSQGIVSLVSEQAKDTKEKLTEFSASSSSRIKEKFANDIKERSAHTLKKDSAFLSQLFQDNSFLQVRDFLANVFKDDEDLLRVTFLAFDQKKIIAWHYIDRMHAEGLDLGTIYNSSSQTWTGHSKKKKVEISDPQVLNIIQANTIQIVETKININGSELDAMDTYIPVYSSFKDLKQLERDVVLARSQGNPIGYLRYTMSLESLRKSVEEEQASFNSYLSKIEQGNQAAVLETQALGRSLQNQILTYLAFAVCILFWISFLLTRFVSNKITTPIKQLIQSAQKISAGEYKQQIRIETDDEVGILARSFQQMSNAIQERDQKLESHAQNLEQLVEERTRELDEQKAVSVQASKMAALGEMAGGVAHEINTPLGTIQVIADYLISGISSKRLEEATVLKSLETIENTITRIAKIVKGLQLFARDGKTDPKIESSAIKIVEDTFSLCREKFQSHGVRLDFEPTSDIAIACRPMEISQVLVNLLNNSFDAIQGLEEKWIRVEVKDMGSNCEISVTDCGSGISKDIQMKIMQPFFTTKELGKGTGLGLSISKGIIESHGGKLEIDNSSPHTRFVIRLPKI